ncbi:MAG: sulfatase family protein [Planctomycetota bacterium]|jgi:N-sulfoglucosamine sulfohydrolase
MDNRPNIVLMVSDDHGLDAGCYGNTSIHTPNMDKLAEDGVVFTQAFCTTASCAASRSVILTGQYNHANGTYGHTHGKHHFSCHDNVVTLPKLLNDAGYFTARVGKQHYAPDRLFPFQDGYAATEFGRDDIKMSENCRKFIKNDKPFFLYWCSANPHRCGGKVEEHPCQPNRFGNPEEAFPGDEEMYFKDEDVEIPPYLSDTPEVRAELAQYNQSVARLDRGIGHLIKVLKEEGKYENTLIIYISDNGAAFPEAKTTLYEAGMNLPCIVKTPGEGEKGVRNKALVTWADMAPTIMDYAESLKEENTFQGESFKPVVGEESPTEWRDTAFVSHTFHEITNYYPMRALRTDKYKFIYNIAHPLTYSFASDLWASATWQGVVRDKLENFGSRTVDAYLHRPKFELYDLENDPNETINLAEKEEHKGLVEDFCRKLQNWQEETGDVWKHKWIYE